MEFPAKEARDVGLLPLDPPRASIAPAVAAVSMGMPVFPPVELVDAGSPPVVVLMGMPLGPPPVPPEDGTSSSSLFDALQAPDKTTQAIAKKPKALHFIFGNLSLRGKVHK